MPQEFKENTSFLPGHQDFPDALIYETAMPLVNTADVDIGKKLLVLAIGTGYSVDSPHSSLQLWIPPLSLFNSLYPTTFPNTLRLINNTISVWDLRVSLKEREVTIPIFLTLPGLTSSYSVLRELRGLIMTHQPRGRWRRKGLIMPISQPFAERSPARWLDIQ